MLVQEHHHSLTVLYPAWLFSKCLCFAPVWSCMWKLTKGPAVVLLITLGHADTRSATALTRLGHTALTHLYRHYLVLTQTIWNPLPRRYQLPCMAVIRFTSTPPPPLLWQFVVIIDTEHCHKRREDSGSLSYKKSSGRPFQFCTRACHIIIIQPATADWV